MSQQSYLIDLLTPSAAQKQVPQGLLLLKKIILLSHQGQLKINDQFPDKRFSLADYLLDNRRLMLDWSLVSEMHRAQLRYWLHTSHQRELIPKFSAPYVIDESRGIPEEKQLSLWQQFLNSSLFGGYYYCVAWPNVEKTNVENAFELIRIDACFSKRGALIDLVSNLSSLTNEPLAVSHDYFDDESLQNVKRVILTDEVIASLVHEDINALDLVNSVSEAHPNSVEVQSQTTRSQRVLAHRYNKQYGAVTSFFWRIIALIKKWWFDFTRPTESEALKSHYSPFCQEKDVSISLCDATGQVLVLDKRVPIDALGLCGGGARIFSYLGVIDVLEEYGLTLNRFSGSSAGAIMASLLYLGYESGELKQKFRWITDHLLLDYDIDFSGLSTTNKMKSALQYFILDRVQDEIKKHEKWFQTDDAKQFLDENVNAGHITFGTIYQLRKMCPELNFGKELIVTGTNTTLRRTEIFSTYKTPNMEIAEAVKISASMPVIYKPTMIGLHSYTDGGVLNNLPLSYFRNDKEQFLYHELSISLNVLALQFDTGVEAQIVDSNKPVYREHWLLNTLYGFLTGIDDPASAWVDDRLTLRHHSAQTILIDVQNIKATKFDIDEAARDELVRSGREAAKAYMQQRYRKEGNGYVSDEYLSKTFENLEALLIHCGNKKKWPVLKRVSDEIKRSSRITPEYREVLLRINDTLEMIHAQDVLKEEGYTNRWRKLLPTLTGLSRMKMGAKQEKKDKSTLYCMLFPVLSQPWQALISNNLTSESRQQLNLIEHFRKKLNVNDQVLVFNGLVDAMEENNAPSHLFFYLFKTLLIYARNEDALDEVKYDVIRFTEAFATLKRTRVVNISALVGAWDFNVESCKQLLSYLCEPDYKAFYKALGTHYQPHFEWDNLNVDDTKTTYLQMVR